MNTKSKSQFQESLVNLYLRLNGYFQSGYIPHSEKLGKAGTDIDRIGVRFPGHSQKEREVNCSHLLDISEGSIDIIIAEVKNKSLEFNYTISKREKGATENWFQILNWIGLFKEVDLETLITQLIKLVSMNGIKDNGSFGKVEYESNYGLITIRPILFVFEKEKSNKDTKLWINGTEILEYIGECFCPVINRAECSTRYPFSLWGADFSDIVEYIKDRDKRGKGIGTLSEMYLKLIK